MRIQKIALGLTVVDAESFAADIEKSYYQDLTQVYGLEIKDKDSDKLYLYHTLNRLINCFKDSDNRKNVIFYIDSNVNLGIRFPKALAKICKVFPVIVYTNTLEFNCLKQSGGSGEELSLLIRDCRYNFDFNRFSPRKMKTFFEKHGIKLTFPF
jgi:hypothetical protein